MKKVIYLILFLIVLSECSNIGPNPIERLIGVKNNNDYIRNRNRILLCALILNANIHSCPVNSKSTSCKISEKINQKPSIPTNLVATQTTTSITLKWKASIDKDGKVIDYRVSKDKGKNWESVGTVTSHTFTGLSIGTIYNLQVRAKDDKNEYSSTAKTSLKLGNLKPTMPASFALAKDVTNKSITLSWNVSTDSDGAIDDYEVSKDSGESWLSTSKTLTYTFTDLKIGETYGLQVRAKDNENTHSNTASISKRLVRSVKKVTLGANHSFIETEDNKLFVFGSNSHGQLGLGDSLDSTKCNNSSKYCYTPVELTDSRIAGKIKKVTLGANHSFIETTENKLFVFGQNNSGQLGLGHMTQKNSPVEFKHTDIAGKIKKVTLGNYHSFIETTENKLFVFGQNFSGELGLGDRLDSTKCNNSSKYCYTPVELTDSRIVGKIKKVTLGGDRSFIETTNKLFVFGANGQGELGLGDTSNKTSPAELKNSNIQDKVKKVTLGANHSFIETTTNKLFVFGKGSWGQLGLGDTSNKTSPAELKNSNIKGKVKKVTLGNYHSFIETTENKLFVFGHNYSGKLGLGDTSNKTSPIELTSSNIKGKVKKVTLGGNRSFIETTDDELFVFGHNGEGQLGLGDTSNKNLPTELLLP